MPTLNAYAKRLIARLMGLIGRPYWLLVGVKLIWIASKSKRYHFNYDDAKEMNDGKQMRNLWDIRAERHVTLHPTEKPVTLLDRIVRIATEPGDAVVDPFMGSGTTGVVAKSLGRSFLGFEIDLDYYKIAVDRIEETKAPSQVPPQKAETKGKK